MSAKGTGKSTVTLEPDNKIGKNFKWSKEALNTFKRQVPPFFFDEQRKKLIKLIADEPNVYQYVGRYDPSKTYQTYYLGTTNILPSLLGITIEDLLNSNPSDSKKSVLEKLLECMPENHRNTFVDRVKERRDGILQIEGVIRLEPLYFLINNTCIENASPQGRYLAAFNEVRLPETQNAPLNRINSLLVCGFQYVSVSEEIFQDVASKPLDDLQINNLQKNEKLLSFLYHQSETKLLRLFLPLTKVMEKILEERAKVSLERIETLEKYQEFLKKELERDDVSLVDIKFLVDEVKEAEALIQKKARELVKINYSSIVKEDTEVYFQDRHEDSNSWLKVYWYPKTPEGQKSKQLERSLGNITTIVNELRIKIKNSIISTFLKKVQEKNLKLRKIA